MATRTIAPLALLIFLSTVIMTFSIVSLAYAYPPTYGDNSSSCSPRDDLVPVRREVYDDGRIFDISHRYREEMPAWGSSDGLSQFLWLPKSMKNGSLANISKVKLPTHMGTNVDAPGHVYDHYFDTGF
ncbi:PREDICTED: uncharacterized protein LOC104598177 [Nelumbo nucifera]|uniref:Uncharacterized protein LOC104598177 n=2 Tax=Nelumbo nucifera TaxID=4432 RepID=A0A1U7ZXB4_NELNU|nr:PREDICTED: uncharacterized protein LOC104598177 [Nelumbo nucifera]DAD31420.1 TPA_asm: hypothetical protein HUJ06_010271 [Nelumbo nucifera]